MSVSKDPTTIVPRPARMTSGLYAFKTLVCAVCEKAFAHRHDHKRICCSDACRRVYDETRLVKKRVMTPMEAAYIAGLLDGEGTISLCREKRVANKLGWRLKPICSVANTSKRLLEWIVAATANGKIFDCTQGFTRGPNSRDCYKWMVYAIQTRWVLPQVLPYLVLKKRQAEIVLRYFDIIDINRRIEPFAEELDALHNEIRALNARGLKSDKSEYTLHPVAQ